MRDFFVEAHDGVRLAGRDHGGDGPAMVLMHGAGSHLLSMGYLARQLHDFHVVTMDGRWSGFSGDAPVYDWAALVRDVETIAQAVELENPIVAGHSWGGMIATYYGAAHPDAPAVINLDGHGGPISASDLDGLSTAEAQKALADFEAARAAVELTTSGDEDWYRSRREATLNAARASGLREDRALAFTDRSFVERAPGQWESRPAATLFDGLTGDLGLFPLYHDIQCPLLVLDCAADDPTMPPELKTMMVAYRRSLARRLDAVASENINVSVAHLDDVDHQGIVGKGAKEVADVIRIFLSSCSRLASDGVTTN